MDPASAFVIARRRAYGVEYLDARGEWTVFLDEAYGYPERTRAQAICERQGGTMVASRDFARLWSHVGSRDVLLSVA